MANPPTPAELRAWRERASESGPWGAFHMRDHRRLLDAYEAQQGEVGRLRAICHQALAAMRTARDEWDGYAPDVKWMNAWDALRTVGKPQPPDRAGGGEGG